MSKCVNNVRNALCTIIVLSMLCTLTFVPTSAAATNELPDDAQEQIEKTLSTVFDYLNSQSFMSLGHLENRSYNIPVEERIVVVNVRNEQIQIGRGAGSEYYPIQKNTSYIYTLTINDIHSGSGSIVLKVNYDVGGTFSTYDDVYKLLVKDGTITVTPPTFYSVRGSAVEINHDWDNSNVGKLVAVTGFSSVVLKDFDFLIELTLISTEGSKIHARYTYGPFND